jgi:hypothetical protein
LCREICVQSGLVGVVYCLLSNNSEAVHDCAKLHVWFIGCVVLVVGC